MRAIQFDLFCPEKKLSFYLSLKIKNDVNSDLIDSLIDVCNNDKLLENEQKK